MRTTRLLVTMRDVVPRVERVIDVPAAITLDELHEVVQVAIGWTDLPPAPVPHRGRRLHRPLRGRVRGLGSAPCRSSAPAGIRSGGSSRSTRTCSPWPSCTTCCVTSGWSASATGCCIRPRPRQTSSRRYVDFDRGSSPTSSPPWSPNEPALSSRPAAGRRDRRRRASPARPRMESRREAHHHGGRGRRAPHPLAPAPGPRPDHPHPIGVVRRPIGTLPAARGQPARRPAVSAFGPTSRVDSCHDRHRARLRPADPSAWKARWAAVPSAATGSAPSSCWNCWQPASRSRRSTRASTSLRSRMRITSSATPQPWRIATSTFRPHSPQEAPRRPESPAMARCPAHHRRTGRPAHHRTEHGAHG